MLEDAAAGLIERLYATVADPKGWQALADELGRVVEASPPKLIIRRFATDPPIGLAVSAPPGLQDAWAPQLHAFSQWNAASAELPLGSVVRLESIVPPSRLRMAAFYREWMRPQGLRWGLQMTLERDSTGETILCFFRGQREAPFSEAAIDLLSALLPHLQRITDIRRKLEDTDLQRLAALEALDRARLAMFLLDARARILDVNRAGKRLLRQNDGLVRQRHGLSAVHPDETERLHKAISLAAKRAGSGESGRESFLTLSRPSGVQPLFAVVRPIDLASGFLHPARSLVGVFVSDPEASVRIPPEALRIAFDITPAEARVASLLIRGIRASRIADALQLSTHTVRNEIKSLFLKTGTNRQSELIRLLLSFPYGTPGPTEIGEP
jgi:DNA-binding CsgD family transcriptional regulator/PAS domain-containing protein